MLNDLQSVLRDRIGETLTPELCARLYAAACYDPAEAFISGAVAKIDARTMNEKVEAFGSAIVASLPMVEIETEHCVHGGIYARTIKIPPFTALTGGVHTKDHINVMRGELDVVTSEGSKRMKGLHVIKGYAGESRAAVSYCETLWTTLCRTDNTDLVAIENELVEHPERLQTRVLALEAETASQLE